MGKQKYKKYLEIGETFGSWEITGVDDIRNKNLTASHWYYQCKCECGTEKSVQRMELIRGRSTSCGCKNYFHKDEDGRECTSCGRYKKWSHFNKSKTSITGYESSCRKCRTEGRTNKKRKDGHDTMYDYTVDAIGRECTDCRKYKGWEEFGSNSYGRNKKSAKCIICTNKQHRVHYETNKEIVLEARKKCRKEARDLISEEDRLKQKNIDLENRRRKRGILQHGRICTKCGVFKTWGEFSKATSEPIGYQQICKSCNKIYRKNNREHINKYTRNRIATDPAFKLSQSIRSRIRGALKSSNSKKFSKSMILIGCSPAECLIHLDNNDRGLMFLDHGPKGNHIDHIIPCAFFDLSDPLEQLICFNYRNLQLLPWNENLSKNAKLEINDEFKELFFSIMSDVLSNMEFEEEFTNEV